MNIYYVAFTNPNCDKETLLQLLTLEFGNLGIWNKNDFKQNKVIAVHYQGDDYTIEFVQTPNFPSALKISTSVKCNFQPGQFGFIWLISTLVKYHEDVQYWDIEYFTEDGFMSTDRLFAKRFLSRKAVCLYTDEPTTEELLKIKLESEFNGCVSIETFEIADTAYHSVEQAWVSIAEEIGHDGWDMTTREFAPITVREFTDGLAEFTHDWGLPVKPDGRFDETACILRLIRKTTEQEYLIKTTSALHYLYMRATL